MVLVGLWIRIITQENYVEGFPTMKMGGGEIFLNIWDFWIWCKSTAPGVYFITLEVISFGKKSFLGHYVNWNIVNGELWYLNVLSLVM